MALWVSFPPVCVLPTMPQQVEGAEDGPGRVW